MAAVATKQLPEGEDWLYELKWDGYRALLLKDRKQLQIRTRNNKNLTPLYPAVAAAVARIKAEQVVIDGEIVALAQDRRPSFQALQHRSSHARHQIVFYAFDVLHLDGARPPGARRHLRAALHVSGRAKFDLRLDIEPRTVPCGSTLRPPHARRSLVCNVPALK